jgi:uroporphyrin-III C-methyltransferase
MPSRDSSQNNRPHVTLVGAGPGDPELLTLKAVNAIRRATVLLVDDLVNPAILEHAAPRARIIHVGKRGGCISTPQSFIEKLMILAVRDGEQVVRLKGGDPFIFGRGGEEMNHLTDAGIQVEVINGITAGLAASTSLGIALTHREHAHGVVFVTGHNRPGEAPIDWAALARTASQCQLTLVIYMGMAKISVIEAGLAQGLPGNTPTAVVQRASLPEQQHALCTLGNLRNTIERSQLDSPSIIIVGAVVSTVNLNTLLAQRPANMAA